MGLPEDTRRNSRRTTAAVIGIALIGGLVPPILYWVSCGSVPTVAPAEARRLLQVPGSNRVLVDVRSLQDFDKEHIDGAQNWPLRAILATESAKAVPSRFQTRALLLICDGGISSAFACRHLRGMGLAGVTNIRGGIQEWIASSGRSDAEAVETFASVSGARYPLPFRESSIYEQSLAVVSGFVIKPTYTLLSLVLIVLLRRSSAPDLVALRWSMICFFVGENFCAGNYLFFQDTSYLCEYLHSFGMLLSFGFATYAVLEGLDRRILMLSDPSQKCAALRLCGRCIKYENVPCGLRRTFFVIIPAFALIAAMPWCGRWYNTSYNTMVFGTAYNYARRLIYQIFEMRYCSGMAVFLLCASLVILAFKKTNPLPLAKMFFVAGVGPLAFGMFRSVLTAMYSQDLVWFAFWEEFTELLFIGGTCVVLWIFRRGLFRERVI